MNHDTREFLDKIACVAQANLNYLYDLEAEEHNLDDNGSFVLMGAYLELYDQFTGSEPRSPVPSHRAYHAADACCTMRRLLELQPRSSWSDDEQGLFTLMLGFMFLFKRLYVVRG